MKKFILLVAILLILTWPSKNINKVDASAFIFEPDSMAVAALYVMLDAAPLDDSPKPIGDKCECNKKTGMISYDGGTSLTKCPCSNGGAPCGCINGKDAGQPITESVAVVDNAYLAQTYYIAKTTASWCGPCKVWNNTRLGDFKSNNFIVKEIDSDRNRKFVEDAEITNLPTFFIQTRVDDLYHYRPDSKPNNKKIYGGMGQEFSLSDALKEMAELDKSLHPAKYTEGISYDRVQKGQTKIGGDYWPQSKVIIGHLRDGNHRVASQWPLEKLSRYELKAIHDDDHAGRLGALNGL